jgi:hypothetical protein
MFLLNGLYLWITLFEIPHYFLTTRFLRNLSGCQPVFPLCSDCLSTAILTNGAILAIRYFTGFPLKYQYQILAEEGSLIDKRRNE